MPHQTNTHPLRNTLHINKWMSAFLLLSLSLFTLFLSHFTWAQETSSPIIPIPVYSARIVDTTGTLSSTELATINKQLKALEDAKGSQIAVLMIPTTGAETIEQYSIRVVEKWQPGRKDINDGILLLIAKKDKRMRIEVGRGLSGAIPDVIASRIIREHIRPQFVQGQFAQGIQAGIQKIDGIVRGEELPPPTQGASTDYQGNDTILNYNPLVWLGIAALGIIAMKVFGRLIGTGATGVVGLGAGLVGGASLATAGIAGIVVALLALILSTRFFWDILQLVMMFSSSNSSGSGDGFSGGGGGSFDGGGASGDW